MNEECDSIYDREIPDVELLAKLEKAEAELAEAKAKNERLVELYKHQQDEIAAFQVRINELREVLEWYGDRNNYAPHYSNTDGAGIEYFPIGDDDGKRARDTLENDQISRNKT